MPDSYYVNNDGSGNILSAAVSTTNNLHPLGPNAHKYDVRTVVGDADYQILPTDRYVVTSVAPTDLRIWTLPSAASVDAGWEITVADAASVLTSGSNTYSVVQTGPDTMNGDPGLSNIAGSYVRVRSNGSNAWQIVGGSPRIVNPPDGWIPSYFDDWTYASSTSFTPGADTQDFDNMRAGTRVKFTQGGTVKYGTVAYTPVGDIALAGNNGYSVANSAITRAAYSNELCPVGYPTWFAWTPTLSGWSANPSSSVYRFKIDGGSVTLSIVQGGAGTSNNAAHTATLPTNITVATITNMAWRNPCEALDNGTTQAGLLRVASGGTVVRLDGILASEASTNSGSSALTAGQLTFEIT